MLSLYSLYWAPARIFCGKHTGAHVNYTEKNMANEGLAEAGDARPKHGSRNDSRRKLILEHHPSGAFHNCCLFATALDENSVRVLNLFGHVVALM